MQKYKLINTKTKEEHLCDKVTIDGFVAVNKVGKHQAPHYNDMRKEKESKL